MYKRAPEGRWKFKSPAVEFPSREGERERRECVFPGGSAKC